MGWGKVVHKVRHAYTKVMGRGPGSLFVGMGHGGLGGYDKDSLWHKAWHEVGHGAGYLTGANAMEDLAEAQAASTAAQIANAERQASINAGNVQQTSEAGTESAISKILKKRSALQRSIKTAGQQRLGD